MHSSTELDRATVEGLRRLDLDGQLLGRLRNAFERTLERQQPALAAARGPHPDYEALRRAMHTVRCAAAQLGALDLADCCRMLEQAGATAQGQGLTDTLDRFERLLDAARTAMATWADPSSAMAAPGQFARTPPTTPATAPHTAPSTAPHTRSHAQRHD